MTEKKNLINSNEDPIILFGKWFEEAKKKEVNDSNAMNLSTISENSKPSSRIVLLKYFDKDKFEMLKSINISIDKDSYIEDLTDEDGNIKKGLENLTQYINKKY